ncbi:hypothetical protein N24_1951 [Corynebacterium suranareeae]|uniref:Uncharacterized protein n=1 Tax=Corynebacterium suranareeae TaxID=2506452 RepID=A0A160PSQ7_9CORY|nr:hypothetical protein [Corynebacterium suranareeae]BAU96213.1 hypothetical protein N24_1951 [Corynebacterium suranareeae]
MRGEHDLLRRDASSGALRLTGPGITIHSGAIDSIADALRNFQRLVLTTGLAVRGHTSLRGQSQADIVSMTRLNSNGSALPGSLILQIISATSPADEIVPDDQVGLFGDDNSEPQLVDTAMKRALELLNDGRRL